MACTRPRRWERKPDRGPIGVDQEYRTFRRSALRQSNERSCLRVFIAALILGAILVAITLARQKGPPGRGGFRRHAANGRGAATAAGVVGVPPARVLNVAVVDQNRAVLPTSAVLAAWSVYEVRIDIGPPSDVRL